MRKSTADGEGAREFYTEVSRPDDAWLGEIRDLVISKKQVCLPTHLLLEYLGSETRLV